jgi:hypothetical protein
MESELQQIEAEINVGYEMYQIIKDFDNPIQIFREAFQNSVDEGATEVCCRVFVEKKLGGDDVFIDIWDNGRGLNEENISCFFGLAKSTKVTPKMMPAGKIGYKGHGTKIFFNSERIEIFSKPDVNGAGWRVILDDPVKQIEDHGIYRYSKKIREKDFPLKLPPEYQTGFYLRIKNPRLFKTQHDRYMLNHLYLRDYAKWYTVFGNIRSLFDDTVPNVRLFLQGLNIDYFNKNFNDPAKIDPPPKFVQKDSQTFEELPMGHYFPPERKEDTSMKAYAKKIGSNKQYYDYYSREIYCNKEFLDSGISFNFVLCVEGYETKRRYDVLLSRREKTDIDRNLQHTDGERYGLWACKGGVPIEKVDEWIIGGRGVGAYTYMHAFVDCDAFELTANRGSVKNTDLEILDQIKAKITGIMNSKKIETSINEREYWESFEKTQRSIREDSNELKERYKSSQKKRYIGLPNGIELVEPTQTKTGYSESETLMLLVNLLSQYPDLFKWKILDYNTTKGIDFVVEMGGSPKYIELKGTLRKKINHSFRNIYKFVCYEISLTENDGVEDSEPLTARLRIKKDDNFESFNEDFDNKKYKSYKLEPDRAVAQSMEVIVLKEILTDVIGAKIK